MKKDSILYVVAFTFVVCAVFVLVLALANESTKDLVEANREFASQSAVLDALGIAWTDRSQVASQYKERFHRWKAASLLPTGLLSTVPNS
jgi:Na+-transporting NADH:ubiquinone oxidoreductase subunit NqrC